MKFWSLVLLAAGTMIGSTVLTLPLEISQYGATTTFIFMFIMCLFSLHVSMYTVEAIIVGSAHAIQNTIQNKTDDSIQDNQCNRNQEKDYNLSSLSRIYLGRFFEKICTISTLGLFFALIMAYISGASSIISSFFSINFQFSCIYTGLVSFLIVSTQSIFSKVNNFLFSLKAISFVSLLVACINSFSYEVLMSHGAENSIQLSKITSFISNLIGTASIAEATGTATSTTTNTVNFTDIFNSLSVIRLLPLFFTAFGFHGSIPFILKSLFHTFKQTKQTVKQTTKQVIDIQKFRRIFLISGIITFSVYIIWIAIVLSNIEPNQIHLPANVSDLVNLLTQSKANHTSNFTNVHTDAPLTFNSIQSTAHSLNHSITHFFKSVIDSISSISNFLFSKFNTFVQIFAVCALATSIIGVSIGLIDFIKDMVKETINNNIKYKSHTLNIFNISSRKLHIIVSFAVFFISTFISLSAPFLFIKFLSFAALFLLLIAVILPCMIVYKQRYSMQSSIVTKAREINEETEQANSTEIPKTDQIQYQTNNSIYEIIENIKNKKLFYNGGYYTLTLSLLIGILLIFIDICFIVFY